MTETETTTVALWYWRYHCLYAELYDDEQEAAEDALRMEDAGEASVTGVQYPDGRHLAVDLWPAYNEVRAAQDRHYEELAATAAANPAPPMREVRSPWCEKDRAKVPEHYPDWVGAQ